MGVSKMSLRRGVGAGRGESRTSGVVGLESAPPFNCLGTRGGDEFIRRLKGVRVSLVASGSLESASEQTHLLSPSDIRPSPTVLAGLPSSSSFRFLVPPRGERRLACASFDGESGGEGKMGLSSGCTVLSSCRKGCRSADVMLRKLQPVSLTRSRSALSSMAVQRLRNERAGASGYLVAGGSRQDPDL